MAQRNFTGLRVGELREVLTGKRTFEASCTITSVEQRSDGGMTVSGYAAVFDAPSKPICGMFIEYIKRGAFRKVLAEPGLDVPLLINHEGVPFSRTTNGTLRLSEDARGLYFSADIVDTNDGSDLYKRVQTGLLDKMSFAFIVEHDEWTYGDDNAYDRRDIWSFAELCDVSIVNNPAYDDTDVIGDKTMDEPRSVTTDTETLENIDSRGDTTVLQEHTTGSERQSGDSGKSGGSIEAYAGDKDAAQIRSWSIHSLVRSQNNESCTKGSA